MRRKRIQKDRNQFLDIVKGKIKKNLRKYLNPGSIILPGKGKKQPIKIQFHRIFLPKVRYGDNFGGVGAGDGEPGDDLGPITGKPDPGKGEKQAGSDPGSIIEVEFSEEEILEMMALELPNLEPKGQKTIDSEEQRWSSARKTGPESLLIKRGPRGMFKKALFRQISSGEYNPRDPKIIPIKDDKIYRSAKPVPRPQNNALMIFMRDISGSVSDEEREIISYFCFFAEALLRRQYDELETLYLVHHTEAEQVSSQEEFLRVASDGGTMISSAHELLVKIVEEKYPVSDWNIYPIYFSDGMNWENDDQKTIKILKEKIIPFSNQYSYGEIFSSWRSWYKSSSESGFSKPGFFGRRLAEEFKNDPRVVYLGLKEKGNAWDALEKFFGKKNNKKKHEEEGSE